MATKDYYVTRDTRHPLYKTRMLTAGVPIPLSGSAASWFRNHFGIELTDEAPKSAANVQTTMVAHEPRVTSAPKPAAPKRKRAAKTKKAKS